MKKWIYMKIRIYNRDMYLCDMGQSFLCHYEFKSLFSFKVSFYEKSGKVGSLQKFYEGCMSGKESK